MCVSSARDHRFVPTEAWFYIVSRTDSLCTFDILLYNCFKKNTHAIFQVKLVE